MSDEFHVIRVAERGERTVVALGGVEFPDESVLEQCRNDLERLLADPQIKTLAFDLAGVVIIPSTMLGMWLTLRGRGLDIEILNPSEDVRAVLDITRLDTRFRIVPPR